MKHGGEPTGERRQWPRATHHEALDCRLEVRSRVRLLDISLSGDPGRGRKSRCPSGTRAQLRSGIASGTLSPMSKCAGSRALAGRFPATGMGAVFVAMDERSRRSLEQFLKEGKRVKECT